MKTMPRLLPDASGEQQPKFQISLHPNIRDIGKGSLYFSGYTLLDVANASDIAGAIHKHAWSPVVWKNGRRSQGNFIKASWLSLDFDTPHFTLKNAVDNIFCDCIHVIGTTRSHQRVKGGITCDRFRVVLKLEKEITDLNTYRATAEHYIRHWDADKACKDGGRFFWPCTKIISVLEEGELVDVIEAKKKKPYVSPFKKAGVMTPWVIRQLTTTIPQGKRNITCYGLGCDLAAAGFSLEKSIETVLRSKTYFGTTNERLVREIERAVTNGWNKTHREKECQSQNLKN